MEFFDVCADWADTNEMAVTFERDPQEGWYARFELHDKRGMYSAVVDHIEYSDEVLLNNYRKRLDRIIRTAVMRARQRRLRLVVV